MNRLLRTIPYFLALSVLSTTPVMADNKTDQTRVPTEIRVPDGYRRVLQTVGRGVQIYDCTDGAWKFREPEAAIYDENSGKKVATHYAGPTWASAKDGSKVVAAVKARRDAPNPQHDIPWLLLQATSNAGAGDFTKVAYIHRLDTVGGAAPSGSCVAGQTARVPYQATYDFWAPWK
jgi:hypothetical protein